MFSFKNYCSDNLFILALSIQWKKELGADKLSLSIKTSEKQWLQKGKSLCCESLHTITIIWGKKLHLWSDVETRNSTQSLTTQMCTQRCMTDLSEGFSLLMLWKYPSSKRFKTWALPTGNTQAEQRQDR